MATGYVDQITGSGETVAYKAPCRVATTANVALNGLQTIDGVVLAVDDRVLVKDQTNAVDNGIWIVSTGVWSRSRDFDSNRDVTKGTRVSVTDGTVARSTWAITTENPINVGASLITFEVVTFGQYGVIDEDDMASDSDTKVPTQQSVKAYVDAGPSTAALQANMRDRIDTAPYVASLAALLALDTSKDVKAFLDGSEFKWDGTDLSSKLLGVAITSTAVDAGTETVTSAGHGLTTNDPVIVTTAVNGLALNTVYYAIEVDANNFRLATSAANASAGTAFNLTGTTNFTTKKLRDPDKFIYVTPTIDISGASGAWIRTEGEALGRGWLNSVPPGNFRRMGDHVLAGKGAAYWNGRIKGSGGYGSWLFAEGEGSVKMNYLLVNSVISAVSDNIDGNDSPYGVLGASRTPSGAYSGGAIGVSGFAKGNATSGSSVVWAAYFDAVKGPSSNSTTEGVEIEVANLNSTPVADQTPYADYLQGRTYGLLIGSGADVTIHPTSYAANTALMVFNNGATFNHGIVFKHNSLTADGFGVKHAISLPMFANVEWWRWDGSNPASASVAFAIRSQIDLAANTQVLLAENTGMSLYNSAAKKLFTMGWVASAVNGVQIVPAATTAPVEVVAQGDDANIDIYLRAKASGNGRLLTTTGGSTALWWSNGAIGFLGAAPTTRKTMAAATGTATRTAFDTASVTLPQLAERVKALIDDFRTYGLHG